MGALKPSPFLTSSKKDSLFAHPTNGLETDLQNIYSKNKIVIGKRTQSKNAFDTTIRKDSIAIVGTALGDEGKGRFVDNTIETLLAKKHIKNVVVVRFQGGNNAGHTVEGKGIKLALHLVPSFVMHKKALGIMDRAMTVHIEDLQTEVLYVEKKVGSLNKRLFLSDEAILCTDLERAEELLNRQKTGRAKGGTGRGIAPSYAHNLDRLGLKIFDLLQSDWEEVLGQYYDRYDKESKAFGVDLKNVEVPDFRNTLRLGKDQKRTVGTKSEFLKRVKDSRVWLLKKDIVTNTFLLHKRFFSDQSIGFIFEGAQSAALDAWLGTRPDITTSNTTVYGIREGTAYWLPDQIEERIGVFKIPYTSSVGERRMPTHVDLPKDLKDLKNPTPDQAWAAFVRESANEYGTTTGRPRDITHLDLELLRYNCRISGIKVLVGTHLDTSQEDYTIKVCTHYTDKKGNEISYQPGLRYLKDVVPQYIELPGWDGEKCRRAESANELPPHAVKFLAFIQSRVGVPIVAVTTGPSRENYLKI